MLNEAFCLSKQTTLDNFKLFYEELPSSTDIIKRVRRIKRSISNS